MEETKNKAAPVIRLQDVRKEYVVGDSHIHALDGVSLTVSPGEFVCISGRSGSGKSTMLNMLAGLEKPTSGEIVILDKHIENMSESARIRFRRQYIGFVFQSYNLIPHQTVLANVELALTISGISGAERRRRAREALEQVGLGDKLKNKPSQLSGGQQQRVSIARALAGNPAVILADEPTGALDSHTGREVLGMLQDLHGQGHTVVLITHDNSIAVQAQRIIRLEDGRVVYDGDVRAPEAIVQPTLNFEPAEQEGDA